ncbi:MAG TPA: NAD(P)H-binding protein [Candidatus Tectomicrobia bacterium]|nr:NAD(P)H-binding protein [Candidatus Tectomicrobia bacterium]
MDIVITGANGAVGTALIRYLSARAPLGAMRLRALVRSLARAQSLYALHTEIVVVDYHRRETLREAVAGAEVVVHLAGALLPRRGESLLQANVDATRALVEAAASAGVKTCVFLSFPDADPVSKNQYLGSKGMAEVIVQQAGFAGAILRVPMILGPESAAVVKLRQMASVPLLPLVGGGAVRLQPIAESDVLAAIVWAIVTAPRPLRVLNLVGPETVTYAELLRRVGDRLGSKPWVLHIPKAVAWLSAYVVGALVPSLGWNRSVFDIVCNEHLADPDEARATLPLALTPLHAALDRALFPLE